MCYRIACSYCTHETFIFVCNNDRLPLVYHLLEHSKYFNLQIPERPLLSRPWVNSSETQTRSTFTAWFCRPISVSSHIHKIWCFTIDYPIICKANGVQASIWFHIRSSHNAAQPSAAHIWLPYVRFACARSRPDRTSFLTRLGYRWRTRRVATSHYVIAPARPPNGRKLYNHRRADNWDARARERCSVPVSAK